MCIKQDLQLLQRTSAIRAKLTVKKNKYSENANEQHNHIMYASQRKQSCSQKYFEIINNGSCQESKFYNWIAISKFYIFTTKSQICILSATETH